MLRRLVVCGASNVSFASSSNLTLPQPLPTAAASLQVSWPSTFSVMITLISLSRQSSPVRNDPSFRGEQPPMVFDLFFHSSQLSEIRFFVFSMSMSSLVTKQRRLIAPLQIVELDRSLLQSSEDRRRPLKIIVCCGFGSCTTSAVELCMARHTNLIVVSFRLTAATG